MLPFLDLFFTVTHVLFIGFTLLGWIWPATRRLHLLSVVLILLSWLGLGLWFGFGYCFLTDWHWQVKRMRGETVLPSSFVKYAADNISGMEVDAALVDIITVGGFALAAVLSVVLNLRDRRQKAKYRN